MFFSNASIPSKLNQSLHQCPVDWFMLQTSSLQDLRSINWNEQVEKLDNKIKVYLRGKEISLLDWKRNGNAACHCSRHSGTVLANYWHNTRTLGETSKMLDTFALGMYAACDQPHSIWLSLSHSDRRADWACCSLLKRCVAITSPVQAPSNEVTRNSINEENDCCVAHGRIGQIYRGCAKFSKQTDNTLSMIMNEMQEVRTCDTFSQPTVVLVEDSLRS